MNLCRSFLFVFFCFFWGNKKNLIYIRLKIKNQVSSLGNWLFLDVVSDSFPPAHTCQLSDWQTHTCTHTLSDSDTSAYIHCKPVLNNTLKKITIQHPLTFFFFFTSPRQRTRDVCVCVFVHFLLSLDIHHTDFQSNSELIWKYIEIWTYSLAYTGELLKSQPPVNHTDLTKRHDAEWKTQRFPGRLLPGMEKHVWTNETKFRTSITSSKFRSLVCMSMGRWRNTVCSH